MILTITGKPIPKARPRARLIRGRKPFVSIYDSQKAETAGVQKQLKLIFKSEPFLTPLSLSVDFYIQRPRSHYGTGRNVGKLKPSAPKCNIKKPDIDNYIKFIMDAMNGIVYKDDSQVVCVKAWKLYAEEEEKTVISIEELKE